jgi:Zn finger protein HypA/HybF involved in hydrogenase expression
MMSWYNQTKIKCKTCSKEYDADINTLTLASKKYKKCPYCNNNTGEVIKHTQIHNQIKSVSNFHLETSQGRP